MRITHPEEPLARTGHQWAATPRAGRGKAAAACGRWSSALGWICPCSSDIKPEKLDAPIGIP